MGFMAGLRGWGFGSMRDAAALLEWDAQLPPFTSQARLPKADLLAQQL